MKIKTLRIKANEDMQDLDLGAYFENSTTIYSTNAQLVKEKNGYYWHVLFTYKNLELGLLENTHLQKATPAFEAFEKEVKEYTAKHPPLTLAIEAAVLSNLEHSYKAKNLEDFLRYRGIGKNKIEKDSSYFTAILAIAKKHQ